jgi:hypothetical protein
MHEGPLVTGLVGLGLIFEWVVAVVVAEWEDALKRTEVEVVMVVGAEEGVLAVVARP